MRPERGFARQRRGFCGSRLCCQSRRIPRGDNQRDRSNQSEPYSAGTVSVSHENPSVIVARLSGQGAKHFYIDGGQTIQSFLREGLIDELTVTMIPVLIGTGRPLFGSLLHDARLSHLSTTAFDFGFVQTKYRVVKDA